ncbi:threonine--tRNA ligase [Secundilactobacillus paracollinoides]|uniref:Threonine--tRNA ligase n=1 Tax=Secundilactobacillus paracollinoides TaxID=240427 RepID=A0A1B2J1E6_9LACO|nr:threonine--tRNA ligase [Secundilactobacillus paracollinoides]ANZ62198.1 threonine--tRNA ligase [Secundilactobacillus paracollinoides]ANZ63887.1 threonine--tRNA ligase [Secundilactobacillus paracollinoides]ANZ68145.1 threonine--tRNA ligase [Secundilactobacillus paracollinoides]KRL76370.1 threonyl-tRNA synthetase [Secundilactobacillus paracollinoides DSM 15502 = JCM 11969]
MSEISLEFPDGSKRQFEAGASAKDVAQSIAISLAKKAVAGKLDGKLINLNAPINHDGKIEIVTKDSEDGLAVLRSTVALLAKVSLKEIFSDIRFGEDSGDEEGLYIDTDKDDGQVSADDLEAISTKIQSFVDKKVDLKHESVSKAEALKKLAGTKFEAQLVEDSEDDSFDFYNVDGVDVLNNGVAFENAGDVKFFRLLSVAGAYFEGKSSNDMLQRIYGTAFYKQADLDADLKARQEARERDHRVIGNDLDLFFVDPKAGAGLPYWMPNGATIRRTIERYIIDKEVADDYKHVYTPVLANLDLYKTSGHWAHYRDDMFPPMDMGDGEMLELRPMNCPSHIQIYNHHIRSYRELPLRIAELGMMHRYEKSGALSGLQRVREMTLNDGHTFVTLDQVQDEFKKILTLIMDVYNDFNITDYTFRLSYRDPANTAKYFDDDEMWNRSQSMLKGAMDDLGLDYYEAEGEAAFYGPKLDIQTKTALGNDETMSTIQLDFMLPEQFDLSYIGADGEKHRPVMIHRGIVGTMERFIAYLTEIYKGAFPTWLAPKQVTIIPVSDDKHGDYAESLRKKFAAADVRVDVDHRGEKMNYLIRDAQTHKIPYTLVVGDQEKANNEVSVRKYGEQDSNSMSADAFLSEVLGDIENYSRADK